MGNCKHQISNKKEPAPFWSRLKTDYLWYMYIVIYESSDTAAVY